MVAKNKINNNNNITSVSNGVVVPSFLLAAVACCWGCALSTPIFFFCAVTEKAFLFGDAASLNKSGEQGDVEDDETKHADLVQKIGLNVIDYEKEYLAAKNADSDDEFFKYVTIKVNEVLAEVKTKKPENRAEHIEKKEYPVEISELMTAHCEGDDGEILVDEVKQKFQSRGYIRSKIEDVIMRIWKESLTKWETACVTSGKDGYYTQDYAQTKSFKVTKSIRPFVISKPEVHNKASDLHYKNLPIYYPEVFNHQTEVGCLPDKLKSEFMVRYHLHYGTKQQYDTYKQQYHARANRNDLKNSSGFARFLDRLTDLESEPKWVADIGAKKLVEPVEKKAPSEYTPEEKLVVWFRNKVENPRTDYEFGASFGGGLDRARKLTGQVAQPFRPESQPRHPIQLRPVFQAVYRFGEFKDEPITSDFVEKVEKQGVPGYLNTQIDCANDRGLGNADASFFGFHGTTVDNLRSIVKDKGFKPSSTFTKYKFLISQHSTLGADRIWIGEDLVKGDQYTVCDFLDSVADWEKYWYANTKPYSTFEEWGPLVAFRSKYQLFCEADMSRFMTLAAKVADLQGPRVPQIMWVEHLAEKISAKDPCKDYWRALGVN